MWLITLYTVHDYDNEYRIKTKLINLINIFKLIIKQYTNKANYISEEPVLILTVGAPLDQTQPAEFKVTTRTSHVVTSFSLLNSGITIWTSF